MFPRQLAPSVGIATIGFCHPGGIHQIHQQLHEQDWSREKEVEIHRSVVKRKEEAYAIGTLRSAYLNYYFLDTNPQEKQLSYRAVSRCTPGFSRRGLVNLERKNIEEEQVPRKLRQENMQQQQADMMPKIRLLCSFRKTKAKYFYCCFLYVLPVCSIWFLLDNYLSKKGKQHTIWSPARKFIV